MGGFFSGILVVRESEFEGGYRKVITIGSFGSLDVFDHSSGGALGFVQ